MLFIYALKQLLCRTVWKTCFGQNTSSWLLTWLIWHGRLSTPCMSKNAWFYSNRWPERKNTSFAAFEFWNESTKQEQKNNPSFAPLRWSLDAFDNRSCKIIRWSREGTKTNSYMNWLKPLLPWVLHNTMNQGKQPWTWAAWLLSSHSS